MWQRGLFMTILISMQVVHTDNKNSICYSDSDIKTTIMTVVRKL